ATSTNPEPGDGTRRGPAVTARALRPSASWARPSRRPTSGGRAGTTARRGVSPPPPGAGGCGASRGHGRDTRAPPEALGAGPVGGGAGQGGRGGEGQSEGRGGAGEGTSGPGRPGGAGARGCPAASGSVERRRAWGGGGGSGLGPARGAAADARRGGPAAS